MAGGTLNISLSPNLTEFVRERVSSGLYASASEVVREALRQSLLRDQENQWIAREAAIGFAQLEAGQTVEIQSEQHFTDLVRGQE